jgi:methylaspartate ammonia-lyase
MWMTKAAILAGAQLISFDYVGQPLTLGFKTHS